MAIASTTGIREVGHGGAGDIPIAAGLLCQLARAATTSRLASANARPLASLLASFATP